MKHLHTRHSSSSTPRLFTTICYLLPALACAYIWLPVISHYRVPTIAIPDTIAERARHFPDTRVLDELNSTECRGLHLDYQGASEPELIEAATNALRGIIPGSAHTITLPLCPDDISRGLPGEQLRLAGFFLPDLLLSAYEATRREEFLTSARDLIVAWALYERTLWLPKGMIWNDYAIAARNETLVHFWALYRNHALYRPDVAKTVLQLVARNAAFLAKPSHFAFASNHGIIQNIALLRMYLAFPTLPRVEEYRALALRRLHDQMTFYINDEGVVLEHSAHYQRFGVHLVGMLFRYLTLTNEPVPPDWENKYERAKEYLGLLRRPDGSLPMYGDTHRHGNGGGPPVTVVGSNGSAGGLAYRTGWRPGSSTGIYPLAGYSVWWDGLDTWPDSRTLNQTVVAWSYFPGHAHKHADEMSVLLYAGGQTWWTNAGYWSYGTKGRAEAESWNGSNAPHRVGEECESERSTELKYYASAADVLLVDMERRGPREYMARRQVVHVRPNLWIILDYTGGDTNARTTTTWTTDPEVTISDGGIPGAFVLTRENHDIALRAWYMTSEGGPVSRYRGSERPFIGWVQGSPADALVVEQSAKNAWAVAVWSLGKAGEWSLDRTGGPYMQSWLGPESWTMLLSLQSGDTSIRRKGGRVYISEGSDRPRIRGVQLHGGVAGRADSYDAIRAEYRNAARRYRPFNDLLSARWKVTYALVCLFVIQEVVVITYRSANGKYYAGLRVLCMGGWMGLIAVWQVIVYWKA